MTKATTAQVDPRALQFLIQYFNSPVRPTFRWACDVLRYEAGIQGWGPIPSNKVLNRLMLATLATEAGCKAMLSSEQKFRFAKRADQILPTAADRIRSMAGQMVQLQGDGVLQALLDARNLITARAKDLIADPNFGSDSHA